jgi:hypothetical protein
MDDPTRIPMDGPVHSAADTSEWYVVSDLHPDGASNRSTEPGMPLDSHVDESAR